MPATNEGVLLFIGAIFFLIGLLGGGFEIAAIKMPSVGKIPRLISGGIGIIFMGIAVSRFIFPPLPPQPTTIPTLSVTPTIIAVAPTETPIPPTHTPVPPTDTPVLPTNTPTPIPTDTPKPIDTPKPTDTPQSPTAIPSETRKLEIFYWWTASGSESEAVSAMFKALKDKYPDVEVVENPMPGGGGDNRAVLEARLTAGTPPDTFQTLGGSAELKNYVDRGVLQPLDDLWVELKYKDVIPGPLAKAVTINGHPYLVPLNMHIQNILYYNQKLFDELKLQAPTTFDDLMAVCTAIKQAKPDMACLGLGSQDKWSDAFVFDSILLAEGSPEYYVKLYKGEIDVTTDATYKSALEKFAQLVPYINKNHSDLTWDQAVGLVSSNQAAMVIMGTWTPFIFKDSNWQPGVDFGAVIFPSKLERILLFHPDCYGMAKNAPHPKTTMDWLRVVASPELQIPTDVIQSGLFARIDIDPKEFPDPIRQEMQDYIRNNPNRLILNQMGSILPNTAKFTYWDIISSYLAGSADIDATIKAVANMMTTYNVKRASAWYQWP